MQWSRLQKAGDEELVQHWQCGNDDAFAVIVSRYQRLVFSVAVRIVKDEAEAEDVVQTVFLDIFRQVGKFDPSRGTLKVWVLQYAYGRSLNRRHQLEQGRFYSNLEIDDLKSSDISSMPAGCNTLCSVEAALVVEEVLAQLSDRQREAIELIYFEGLKFVEAVERTGESLPQLRHNYYRGLMKIRDIMEAKRKSREKDPPAPPAAAIRLEVANAKPRTV
jgi:RNA polymerase sigma-70 factor (ECF subfamily)